MKATFSHLCTCGMTTKHMRPLADLLHSRRGRALKIVAVRPAEALDGLGGHVCIARGPG